MFRFIIKTLFFSLMYSMPLHADGQNPDLSDIEKRELSASRLNNYINHLDRSYAYYQRVRDHKFYGKNGIEVKVTKFFQQALSWVDRWSSVIHLIDLTDVDSIDQIFAMTQKAFEEQQAELQHLQLLAKEALTEAQQAMSALDSLSLPESAASMPSPEILSSTKKNVAQLQNAVRSLAKLVEQRLAELERIQTIGIQASENKLKQSLLQVGRFPLEQSLARFRELIQVQNLAGTLLAQLMQKENELDRAVLNMAKFQADDLFQSMKRDCQQAEHKLISLNSAFADHARKRIEQVCQAAESHWKGLNQLGLENYEMVYEYTSFLKLSVTKECRKTHPIINCEQTALMQAISLSDLQKMSDDRLKFVELAWADWEQKLLHPAEIP